MEFCKSIKIGPVRVYVTTFRMKKRTPRSGMWRPDLAFKLGNLELLCNECHKAVHRDEWGIDLE